MSIPERDVRAAAEGDLYAAGFRHGLRLAATYLTDYSRSGWTSQMVAAYNLLSWQLAVGDCEACDGHGTVRGDGKRSDRNCEHPGVVREFPPLPPVTSGGSAMEQTKEAS